MLSSGSRVSRRLKETDERLERSGNDLESVRQQFAEQDKTLQSVRQQCAEQEETLQSVRQQCLERDETLQERETEVLGLQGAYDQLLDIFKVTEANFLHCRGVLKEYEVVYNQPLKEREASHQRFGEKRKNV